jgi:hypothetical protein
MQFFHRLAFLSTNKDNENALEASYRISYLIARRGKNHTIADNLISPCVKDVVLCMIGEQGGKRTLSFFRIQYLEEFRIRLTMFRRQ